MSIFSNRSGWMTCLAFACGAASAPSMVAEEPAKRFLERLRDEQLFDIGIQYIEIAEKRNRIPESLRADLPLEKIGLLQDSLLTLQKPDQIEARMRQLEEQLRSFLASAGSHPRKSEAQTRLGDLLRDRAAFAIQESKKPENSAKSEELKEKARKGYSDAIALYVSINEELKPILQNLAGNRAQTAEDKALRDRYQEEYRQAEILHAKTLEFLSQTYPDGSTDWKQWLEKSEAKLSEIIEKTTTSSREAGRRILCLLYRGQVQAKLGKWKEARESFTRVTEINEAGIFRTWKIEATAGLVRLELAQQPPKYEAAIGLGDELAKSLSAQERSEPQGIELQLALADARLAYGKTLTEGKDGNLFRNNRKAARDTYQNLLKINGPHKERAAKGLSELGFDTAPANDESLPETKSFQEATAAAKIRLERAENSERTLPILKQQNASADDIDKLAADVARDREQAIALYRRSLELFREADGREALLESKYFLAYLYLRTDKLWEALAVSQAVLQADRHTDKAIQCGEFALVSLSRLIDATPKDQQAGLIPTLETIAKLMLEIAPGTDASRNAVDVLVTLSIREKKYEDAERYVEMSGGNSIGGASLLGQMLWRDYQLRAAEHRTNKTEETAEDKALLAKAESLLQGAWKNLSSNKADNVSIHGANALASIYLAADRIDEANQILNDPQKGTLVLMETNDKLEAKDKLESYKLRLQAMVQAAGLPNAKPLDTQQLTETVDRMKALAGADDTLLTNALRNLAYSITTKVSQTSSLEDQARLGGALGVLVQQLVALTSDISVLDSAGSSVFVLASNLQKVPGLAVQSKELMEIADQAYSKIASKTAEEIAAANRKPEEFQMRIAMARAGAGKYEEAHKIFVDVLKQTPMNVTFQIAAAKNLQAWGGNRDKDLLYKAWAGTEPNDKGANAIWGWNRIAQLTASRVKEDSFRDIYFEARFNIATCQRASGLLETDPEARKKELNRAMTVIRQTKVLHPNFGTPEFKSKFERLEAELQQDLNR
ncbi:hypothetical protein VN12_17360 [Pirellula sp. SH-Sr6A]|uniref:hypothetical protein n=1 Tax=Pirellula sp. SH-Sr6A TaxID=1632865 RepID=UPI00078E8949|nr:hypothetical protein [Pirellula sp. SH-Sr6A]AMV33901.1 hypothetical protein VN12_17360 [Pirellula sp. SH-Sr6A]